MTKTFHCTAPLWQYAGTAAWYFISLPSSLATDIDFYFAHAKHGWGSLPVQVTLHAIASPHITATWNTSIFPDRKTNTYLLPIKKSVRTQAKITAEDMCHVELEIHG